MDNAGIQEPAGQSPGTPARTESLATGPGVDAGAAGGPQAENSEGRAAYENVRSGPPCSRIQRKTEVRRRKGRAGGGHSPGRHAGIHG